MKPFRTNPKLVIKKYFCDMHAPFLAIDTTYYKLSNPEVGSTKQELINSFENKIYTFL